MLVRQFVVLHRCQGVGWEGRWCWWWTWSCYGQLRHVSCGTWCRLIVHVGTLLMSMVGTTAVSQCYHHLLRCSQVCVYVWIARRGMPSSSGLLSSPFVARRGNASSACCLIPVRCTTLKSISDSRRRYWASRLVKSAKLRVHLRASWSRLIVYGLTFKCGCKWKMAHTIAIRTR